MCFLCHLAQALSFGSFERTRGSEDGGMQPWQVEASPIRKTSPRVQARRYKPPGRRGRYPHRQPRVRRSRNHYDLRLKPLCRSLWRRASRRV
jgi:hypothetical protein